MHEHAQAPPASEAAQTETAAARAQRLDLRTPAGVLMLQRCAGNAATARMLAREVLEAEHPEHEVEPVTLSQLDASKKSALEKKYSVTVSGPWSAEDFADLENGLAMLTAAEAKRLKGWDLVRVASLGGNSGLTTMDGAHNKIEYADSAFDHGGTSGGVKRTPMKINGVPQGRHVVLHEVGHVVLYTNSDDTAEKAWNAGVGTWITKDISTQPNGKATAPAEELYCESFACFHTGPSQLKSDAPQAHAFFASGRYLS